MLSKPKEKQKAFDWFWEEKLNWQFSETLTWFLDALSTRWLSSPIGGTMKSKGLAPAVDFAKIHPHWKQIYLSTLPTFPLEDLLAHVKPEEVLTWFKSKGFLAQFQPKDVVAQFKPKDLLAQFKPADLLAQIKPEDIENYLTQLKQSSRPTTAKAKPKPKKRK